MEQVLAIIKQSYGSMVGFVSHTGPAIVATSIVLVIGLMLARTIKAGLSWLLGTLKFERLAERIGLANVLRRADVDETATEIVCRVSYWLCLGFVMLATLGTMGVAGMTAITAVTAIIPKVVLAAAILVIGVNVSAFVSKLAQTAAVNAEIRQARLVRNVMHYALSTMIVLLALKQFDVPTTLVTQLFLIAFGATALGFGLAFGLGSRDLARTIAESTWEHEQDQTRMLSQASELGNKVFPNGAVKKHGRSKSLAA